MRNRRILALFAALMMLFVHTVAMAEDAAVAAEDPVLAIVNGTEITLSQVQRAKASIENYYAQYGYDLSGEEDQHSLRQMALRVEVQQAVMMQKAAELGMDQLSEETYQQLVEENEQMWASAIADYVSYFGLAGEDATDEEKQAANMQAIAY